MSINISIKKKFVVNGREYGSIDEMPDNIRDAYRKAMEGLDAGRSSPPPPASARIVFNGQEYADTEAMPPDVRQAYESIMEATVCGESHLRLNASIKADGPTVRRPDMSGTAPGRARPVGPEPLFSVRQLLLAAAAVIGLLLYYCFFMSRPK